MMAAMVLSIGCMAVPVGACENVDAPAGVAEASIYSPECSFCKSDNVTYLFEQPDGFGHTMVFMHCNDCDQMYHYYV